MSPTIRHAPHRVYPYELFGNTLVVQPRGDAVGFALHEVRTEMAEICHLAQDSRVRHLLIDLSTERYYGSMVLGDLVEFGQLVRRRGGRIGLCGASSELLSVLRLMHLDETWEIFPAIAAGLQSIASIPVREQIWRRRWIVAAILVLGSIGTAIALWPKPNRGLEYGHQLVKLWEDFESRRALAGDEELHRLSRKVRTRLEPIVADLSQRSRNGPLTSLEEAVLLAAQPWLRALDMSGLEAQQNLDEARFHLNHAETLMAQGPHAAASLPQAAIPAITPDTSESLTDDGETVMPALDANDG